MILFYILDYYNFQFFVQIAMPIYVAQSIIGDSSNINNCNSQFLKYNFFISLIHL